MPGFHHSCFFLWVCVGGGREREIFAQIIKLYQLLHHLVAVSILFGGRGDASG